MKLPVMQLVKFGLSMAPSSAADWKTADLAGALEGGANEGQRCKQQVLITDGSIDEYSSLTELYIECKRLALIPDPHATYGDITKGFAIYHKGQGNEKQSRCFRCLSKDKGSPAELEEDEDAKTKNIKVYTFLNDDTKGNATMAAESAAFEVAQFFDWESRNKARLEPSLSGARSALSQVVAKIKAGWNALFHGSIRVEKSNRAEAKLERLSVARNASSEMTMNLGSIIALYAEDSGSKEPAFEPIKMEMGRATLVDIEDAEMQANLNMLEKNVYVSQAKRYLSNLRWPMASQLFDDVLKFSKNNKVALEWTTNIPESELSEPKITGASLNKDFLQLGSRAFYTGPILVEEVMAWGSKMGTQVSAVATERDKDREDKEECYEKNTRKHDSMLKAVDEDAEQTRGFCKELHAADDSGGEGSGTRYYVAGPKESCSQLCTSQHQACDVEATRHIGQNSQACTAAILGASSRNLTSGGKAEDEENNKIQKVLAEMPTSASKAIASGFLESSSTAGMHKTSAGWKSRRWDNTATKLTAGGCNLRMVEHPENKNLQVGEVLVQSSWYQKRLNNKNLKKYNANTNPIAVVAEQESKQARITPYETNSDPDVRRICACTDATTFVPKDGMKISLVVQTCTANKFQMDEVYNNSKKLHPEEQCVDWRQCRAKDGDVKTVECLEAPKPKKKGYEGDFEIKVTDIGATSGNEMALKTIPHQGQPKWCRNVKPYLGKGRYTKIECDTDKFRKDDPSMRFTYLNEDGDRPTIALATKNLSPQDGPLAYCRVSTKTNWWSWQQPYIKLDERGGTYRYSSDSATLHCDGPDRDFGRNENTTRWNSWYFKQKQMVVSTKQYSLEKIRVRVHGTAHTGKLR